MSLATQIESIINTLYPAATFMFSSEINAKKEVSQNGQALPSGITYPFIVYDNYLSSTSKIKENANILSKEKIVITVLNIDDRESTDSQSQVVVDAMKVIAERIMINIWRLDEIREEDPQFLISPVIRQWSNTLSGVVAFANWDYNKIINWCKT